MKFTEKIEKGADIFERFNEDLHVQLEDIDRHFHDVPPVELARRLYELNEKWQAFVMCVRAGYIVVENGMLTPDNDN